MIVTDIGDLRLAARRRIPRALFDYIDRGAYDEVTYRWNSDDLKTLNLRQRILVDVSVRSLATTLLGEAVSLPVAIAPTGLTGLFHGNGEMLAARAAEEEGTKFCLSTMSICSIEDVASVVSKPFWFQLYVFKDRGFSSAIIARAREAGCSALFVTVDFPVRGQRHADIKNGLTVPPRLTMRNIFDVATKPDWALKVLFGKRKTFGNIEGYLKREVGMLQAGAWANNNFDPSLNWRDIEWLRSLWPGKLVLKGITDIEDAKTASAAGVDGIVVSNHGGRQLDGGRSAISALPLIAEAVGERIEVMFDSGIRSGQDVLKALALGARGCLIGRAALYGLAADGEAGVRKALDIIRRELDVSMALTGTRSLKDVSRAILMN